MELDEAKHVHDERLMRWPLHRLRTEGLVLTGVVVTPSGSFLGQSILTLRAGGGELPYHKFRCE